MPSGLIFISTSEIPTQPSSKPIILSANNWTSGRLSTLVQIAVPPVNGWNSLSFSPEHLVVSCDWYQKLIQLCTCFQALFKVYILVRLFHHRCFCAAVSADASHTQRHFGPTYDPADRY